MKNGKVTLLIFCLLITGPLFGLALAGWRTVDYGVRMHLPLHALWFGVKALCFIGILAIGAGFYSLLRKYNKQGYFDADNIMVVRAMGYITVFVAVMNSVFHVLTEKVISAHATALPPTEQLLRSAVGDMFFESPVLLFFSLVALLFASFMQKAIQTKRENESFI